MTPEPTPGEKFQRLVEIMARLRAPGGCPWDREQTFDTIKPYTLEETYEVLDAIDRARLEGAGGGTGRLHAAGGLLRADGRRAEAVPHRATRWTRSTRSWSGGIRTFSATESAETAGDVQAHLGRGQSRGEEGQGQAGPALLGGGPARAAGAGGGAADRVARRGRGVRLGERRNR